MASVLANTALSVTGRGVGLVIGLAVTALLGRVLGVEQFGVYALVLSFGALLHVMTDWGLYLSLARELGRKPDQQSQLLATTTGLRLAIFVPAAVIGALILKAIPAYAGLLPVYAVAAGGFLFQSLSQLLMGVFQARGTMWQAVIGDVAGRGAQLAVVIALAVGALVALDNPLLLAVAAFTLGTALAYAVHVGTAPLTSAWKFTFAPAQWRTTITQAWPLGLMLILNAIYFRIDIIMLSWFRGGAELGWYGLAYRVVESGLFIPAAFGGLLLPKLSGATGSKRVQLVSQGLLAMVGSGLLVFVLLAGSATPLMVLFAGQAFAPSGPLLAILSAALAVMFLGNIFGFTLVAIGRQRFLLGLYAALAVGNVLANLVAIPRFGALGAAWTTVATEAVSAIAAAVFVYRFVPYTVATRHVLTLGAAAAIAAAGLAYLLTWLPVVAAIVGAGVLFVIVAAALGLLRREHVALLLET